MAKVIVADLGETVDVRAAAVKIGCTVQNVYRMIEEGGLVAYRQRGRAKGILIPVSELERFVEIVPAYQRTTAKPKRKGAKS